MAAIELHVILSEVLTRRRLGGYGARWWRFAKHANLFAEDAKLIPRKRRHLVSRCFGRYSRAVSRDSNINLDRSWMVMVAEIGIEPEAIITRADLHPEVFEASNPTITFEQYLAMFAAADAVAGGPALAIRLAEATSELFSVPVFAAVCSPDLYVATQRLSDHKRLMALIRLDHERHSGGLTVTWHIDADPTLDIPVLFYAFELRCSSESLNRNCQRIVPIRVSCRFRSNRPRIRRISTRTRHRHQPLAHVRGH